MREITVRTQKEIDALPESFLRFTIIKIVSKEIVDLRKNWHNSSVVLLGDSKAVLWDNSSAVLRDNSKAVLWDDSSAVLWDNSRAMLWHDSSAVLWDNSRAELWDNSKAELWDNSSAVLRENSKAVLWDNSSGHIYSENVTATLFSFSVIWLFKKCNVIKKSKDAKVQIPNEIPKIHPLRSA